MKKQKLVSTSHFDPGYAKRQIDMRYYNATSRDQRQQELLEKEKAKFQTSKWQEVTKILEHYKTLAITEDSPVGKILFGLYKKNLDSVANISGTSKNTNLLRIVSKVEILLLVYREIRGNKGALTRAAGKSILDMNKMTTEQKKLLASSQAFPDGFSREDVYLTSKLLKKGLYPWGSSRRIQVNKPGSKDKKRPITIPLFMDKVVQKAIEWVLVSIYEPVFEKLNRSFGFRPNKGVHDAISAILSGHNTGMRTAIEGDIKAAYDSVNRDKLISILEKRITDRKFIKLIKDRLNYDFMEDGNRFNPKIGLPQDGIDSPYLFNIYMNELDDFVHKQIQDYVNSLNTNLPTRKMAKIRYDLKNKMDSLKKKLPKIKKEIKTAVSSEDLKTSRMNLYSSIKLIRQYRHLTNRIKTDDAHKKNIRIFYVRYADDWIILTNGNVEIGDKIKRLIKSYLKQELSLTLSMEKTFVTDIYRNPAKFLGFEMKGQSRGPLYKPFINKEGFIIKHPYPNRSNKTRLQRRAGLPLWSAPDRSRLINRLHIKGFCDRKGFPREVPWLSTFEPHVIIERFNASILGLCQYYFGYIRNPSKLGRWIYILRYSCLKTLAQKYKTSIKGIFKRFGYNLYSKSDQTVAFTARQTYKDQVWSKTWILLTPKNIKRKLMYSNTRKIRDDTFNRIEKGYLKNYPTKEGRVPKVTNEDYLKKVTFVSWRTQASFDLPCSICGSFENVQMHHLRHIRKRAYALIPGDKSFEQVMSLRNRKQIPVCAYCHTEVIHKGEYSGLKLIRIAPARMPHKRVIDLRILNLESFIKPTDRIYEPKTLKEKGWKEITPNNQ